MDKISKWSKWDLHIHTRASKRKKQNSEYFGEGFTFTDDEIEDFVNHIFSKDGPKLIAISDHDCFDDEQFRKIKQCVNRRSQLINEDLCCLPGVECDVYFKIDNNKKIVTDDAAKDCQKTDRVHLVLVFNDNDWNEDKYKLLKEVLDDLYQDDTALFINEVDTDNESTRLNPFIKHTRYNASNKSPAPFLSSTLFE